MQRMNVEAQICHSYCQGFVVTTSIGNVHLYDKDDDGIFKCIKTQLLEGGQIARSICGLSEDSVAFITSTGEIFKLTVTAGSRGKVGYGWLYNTKYNLI